MNRLRNVRLVGYLILLTGTTCFGQNAASSAAPAPAGPTITIPSYPDNEGGLQKMINEMLKLSKDGDTQTLAAYTKSMVLPDPGAWYESVFGSYVGPTYAADTEQARASATTTTPLTLQKVLNDKKTYVEVHKLENSCAPSATEQEYPLLLKRERPVPLYDVRFRDKSTQELIWYYFAYVDGGFRYVGKLSGNIIGPPKKQTAPEETQASIPKPLSRVRVGADVAAALLIHQVAPSYPQAAKDAHIKGTVVIHAVIGKDGALKDTYVISGVCVLAEPALDAVKKWRYKPTLLNGEPVEVDTTISVIFTLG
jgi:TonB family protein